MYVLNIRYDKDSSLGEDMQEYGRKEGIQSSNHKNFATRQKQTALTAQ
jgi:hypothetical protein